MKIIEGEFECPVSHIFSYVSDEPVASASFGQVYPYVPPSCLCCVGNKLFGISDVVLFFSVSLFLVCTILLKKVLCFFTSGLPGAHS